MSEHAVVPQMFSVDEVATRLHVHVQTVRGWIRSGALGHYDVGRYDLVAADQLADFLAQRRSAASTLSDD